MIGPHMFLSKVTSETWCNMPQKFMPVKVKQRQKVGGTNWLINTLTVSIIFICVIYRCWLQLKVNGGGRGGWIFECSLEGGDQNQESSSQEGWGSKFWLFCDNLITECPRQKVLPVFKSKNFAIIFPFSNHFLTVLQNMSLNNS